MTEKLRITMMSIGYVLQHTPSDKVFVNNLITNMADCLDVSVWSLNDATPATGTFKVGQRRVFYRNTNRIFHKPIFEDFPGQYRPHPRHSNVRNALEIGASLAWQFITNIRDFLFQSRPNVIHLTDSFGPAALILKLVSPNTPITMTKPTIRVGVSNKWTCYKVYVKLSLIAADQVITFTNAAANEIEKLGIPRDRINVIPWGAEGRSVEPLNDDVLNVRKKYGCEGKKILAVLTDRFISEAQHSFFDKCAELSNIEFVWAIRPTRYSKKLQDFSRKNVLVENGPTNYLALLEAADLLISIPEDESAASTSLLPLAWIEAMNRGTPVMTVDQPGVCDLIVDGVTGILTDNSDQILDRLAGMKDSHALGRMQWNCKDLVDREFNIDSISKRYGEIWQRLDE